MKNTSKSAAYAGTREICDTTTGEITRAVVVRQRYKDRDFIKEFLPEEGVYHMRPRKMSLPSIHLFDYLCIIGGKDNVAVATMAELQERTEYSEPSVNRAKKQLMQMDYIRKKANNIYMLNPEIVAKVDGDKRQAIVEAYAKLPRK